MEKRVVERRDKREDGTIDERYAIFYTFTDEGASSPSTETPKPASTAAPSATESDVIQENGQ